MNTSNDKLNGIIAVVNWLIAEMKTKKTRQMRIAAFVAFDSKRFLIRFSNHVHPNTNHSIHNDAYFGEKHALFFSCRLTQECENFGTVSAARKNFAKRKQAHKLFDDVYLK